jgi:hypothetical protein
MPAPLHWMKTSIRSIRSIRSILIGAGNRGASPRNSSQKRAICKSSAAPLILGRFNDLDRVFYFFPLAACFEAAAVLFFCVFALVFACFCEAFLFVAFGDLSPIEIDITHVNGSSASQNYNFRQPQPRPRSPNCLSANRSTNVCDQPLAKLGKFSPTPLRNHRAEPSSNPSTGELPLKLIPNRSP